MDTRDYLLEALRESIQYRVEQADTSGRLRSVSTTLVRHAGERPGPDSDSRVVTVDSVVERMAEIARDRRDSYTLTRLIEDLQEVVTWKFVDTPEGQRELFALYRRELEHHVGIVILIEEHPSPFASLDDGPAVSPADYLDAVLARVKIAEDTGHPLDVLWLVSDAITSAEMRVSELTE